MLSTNPTDPTFRSYNAVQAQTYAVERRSYPNELYDTVLKYHTNTGGKLNQLLDVGCGPGNATRDLSIAFDHAVGADPSAEMIAAARSRGGKTRSGDDIKFEISLAEECSKINEIGAETVDLLTVAMAAHWFNMDAFWTEAAKVLKPGGSVALWTLASLYCHPCTPNAAEVQRILFHLEREVLAPFELPSNRLSRDMYDKLVLPWDVMPPITAFSSSDFVRHEWDRDGILSNGNIFFGQSDETSLNELERGLATSSMVTRWRNANPDLVGTDKDCVRETMKKLKEALNGQETFIQGSGTVLLLFKKQSS
ncbi:unnamed protein product [Adineta steineri]|uniref:Methyltransferase type 11 domain-containing protein n=1 Tax=Adineta steineri TaxID=433720 RepID=A0A813WGT2_9BILA|nr:unnamed protein product [Adineta steineri]CAF4019472.1 unnamed protein product [Adineta steineri]